MTPVMITARDRKPRGPWQFSMKTLMLLPVYSIVLGLGFYGIFTASDQEALGIGFASITLNFVVLDSATSSLIPGAVVGLYDADQRTIIQRAATSTRGKAALTRQFPFYFSGKTRSHRAKALVPFEPLCFEVSAPGYKPAHYWLSQFTGRTHDLELSKPIPVAVVKIDRLEKAPAPGERTPPQR
jgi:hypothetical protein